MRALLLATLLFPTAADPLTEAAPTVPTPHVSTDMMDTQTLTRFQLMSRITFAKPDAFNRSASTLAHELRANLAVSDSLSVSFVLPFGQLQPGVDGSRDAFVGNVAFGTTLSVPIVGQKSLVEGTRIQLALGIDLYAPSSPDTRNAALAAARGLVGAIRGYEVQLFVPRFTGARARAQVGLAVGDLHAAFEVGLLPGATTTKPGGFMLLLGASARVSYEFEEIVEPFLEMGGARQIAGNGDVDPPFLFSPGVRFHLADFFDPAIFLSLNAVDPSALIFGIDLAFAVRPTQRRARDYDEIGLDDLEFGDLDF